MLTAKEPYSIEYSNPANSAVRVIYQGQVIASATHFEYIAAAFFHPKIGIIIGAVGVNDYYAIRNWSNNTIEIHNVRAGDVIINTVTYAGDVFDWYLDVTTNGVVKLDLITSRKESMYTSLLNVLIQLLHESGLRLSTQTLPNDVFIAGINLQTIHNRDKIINDLCELLATDFHIIDDTVILTPYNLDIEPLYLEEQEHAFSVAYSMTSDSSAADDVNFDNIALRYIPDYKPERLLDYKKEISNNDTDAYLYDTAIVCDDATAAVLLANARTSKIYKKSKKRVAVVSTTPDYLRLQVGDFVGLNGRFWVVTSISFNRGKVDVTCEERAINARYPDKPIYAKPPVNQPEPPPPPPLDIIYFKCVAALSSQNRAPFFLYISPQISLKYYIDNRTAQLNLARLFQLSANITAISTHICLYEDICDNNISGWSIIDDEILWVQRGKLLARGFYGSSVHNHAASSDTYVVSDFSHLTKGQHAFVGKTSNNLYTMINAVVNSNSPPPRTEIYPDLANPNGKTYNIFDYAVDL